MEKRIEIIDGKEEEIITKLDDNYIERNDNMSFEDTIDLEKIVKGCGNNE